jgi:5-methylcytosine-specific restriction endonuclease McrA
VAALSPDRYRVQVTVGAEAHDDLRCLQDLLRREIPDGDPAAIVARALRLLRMHAEKAKFSATLRPRPGRGTKPGSRAVPAEVERRVWRRDGGQCAFLAQDGRRCTERSYLEFHDVEPHALDGEATVENIALRCRAHNVYEAELLFGAYDPSRVRETPAVYVTRSNANWSRDQLV